MSSGTAPDSICPRGWMMAGYSGNESYRNLINSIYGRENGQAKTNIDTALPYTSLSLFRSGRYYYSDGSKDARDSVGNYWESRIYSNTSAHNLLFSPVNLLTQYTYPRGYGFSLRYVSRS